MGLTTRKTTPEFIESAKLIHGDKYNYENVLYKNNKTQVSIYCDIHGEFSIRPDTHLYLKQGCYECGQLSSITTRREIFNSRKIDISNIEPIENCSFIPVGKEHYAIVDNKYYDELIKTNWTYSNGYANSSLYGGMHRFIMGLKSFENLEVDHINHNKLDNRVCNLRICTRNENEYNKKPFGNSSVFKGVHRNKRSRMYYAKITKDGISYNLGTYENEKEAALAYNNKAIELFGEFAYLNNIE